MTTRALVLGGGGVAGVAWELGVLSALEAAGVPVTDADLMVGTSAGSTVVAQLGLDPSAGHWFAKQLEPPTGELTPDPAVVGNLMETMINLYVSNPEAGDRRRATVAMALGATTVDEATRRAVIAARLPHATWADRDIRITAVDTETAGRVVFTRDSGVDLVDAVAASCAVPGVWPPVTIDGHRYVDGGVFSLAHVDLARGYDRVLVVAPIAGPELPDEVGRLQADGASVMVITPDADALAAFGPNVLDPAVRAACAHAGRHQGVSLVESAAAFWS